MFFSSHRGRNVGHSFASKLHFCFHLPPPLRFWTDFLPRYFSVHIMGGLLCSALQDDSLRFVIFHAILTKLQSFDFNWKPTTEIVKLIPLTLPAPLYSSFEIGFRGGRLASSLSLGAKFAKSPCSKSSVPGFVTPRYSLAQRVNFAYVEITITLLAAGKNWLTLSFAKLTDQRL